MYILTEEHNALKLTAQEAKDLFLHDRDSYIPEVLSKNTNSAPVRAAFAQAVAPPALWKIDR